MIIRLCVNAALLVGGASLLACGDSVQVSRGDPSAREAPADDGRQAPRASSTPRLTGAQIASVTTAANLGEIAQANAALPKLTRSEAKDFASMMVEMHGAAQKRQAKLARDQGLVPEPNAVSAKLTQESDAIVEELGAGRAGAIDRLYIEKQVAVHQQVLNTIDDVLLPSASDAALKDELQKSRTEVAMHLERARAVMNDLE